MEGKVFGITISTGDFISKDVPKRITNRRGVKHGAEAIQGRRNMRSIEDKEYKHGGRRKKNASGG